MANPNDDVDRRDDHRQHERSRDRKEEKKNRDDDDDDDDVGSEDRKLSKRKREDGDSDDDRRRKRRSRGKDRRRYDDDDDDDDKGDSRRRRRDRKKSSSRRKRDDDKRSQSSEDADKDDDENTDRRRRKGKSSSSRRNRSSSRRHRRHRKKSSSSRNPKKKRGKRSSSSSYSSSSSDSDSSSSSSSSSSSDSSASSRGKRKSKKKVVNERLLAKLNARGETLEERNERRAQKRAANIQARFGYTAEDNPFNDPNLHETFTWNKRTETTTTKATTTGVDKQPEEEGGKGKTKKADTLAEIENIRRRRQERDAERDEMDRIRAEEMKMKEWENYDEWAKKEEEFHLEQQRKRSAIRLVEGREKPIDVLAKNLLMFGLTDAEKKTRAAVKYQERYNALDQLDKLEAELEEPYKLIKVLKLTELKELLTDIEAFRMLEKQGMDTIGDTNTSSSKSSILLYWDALNLVAKNEVMILERGGDASSFAKKIEDIKEIFQGQSRSALDKMKAEVEAKLRKNEGGDRTYWLSVQDQLVVYLAMMDLKDLHSKMLVRQLERLEQRKEQQKQRMENPDEDAAAGEDEEGPEGAQPASSMVPKNVAPDFGNGEEGFGEDDEVDVNAANIKAYAWSDKYKPRKPRYFNRVKTGYDWNKYNQTHYDSENPPPKTVQGYKFNIFYPDLVDPTKTPKYKLERADSDDFCILRFSAGPPYEDIAFKIINREWNRSRKRGFRCTFERGVLSLYFNFTTHWYRR